MVQTLDMRAATEGIWRMTSSLVSPLKWCKIPWLLKNSFAENSQKKLCDRKPYKRRSPIWWTFTIPQISAVFAKPEFFNSHVCYQSLSLEPDAYRSGHSSTIRRFEELV